MSAENSLNSRSIQSAHWTDEQLIEYLYGIGPQNSVGHIEDCGACSSRLAAMRARRGLLDTQAFRNADLSTESLAAQRHAVYTKIERRAGWSWAVPFRKWTPAACALLLLSAGFAVWENRTGPHAPSQVERLRAEVSDEQLADEVSQMADRTEPAAAAPLEGLFEN